jgi:predicted transcriptional regulator
MIMAIMTIRTTVAFDIATAQRLDRLANLWGISKSETLRRALETAEKQAQAEPNFGAMTPREAFEWLRTHPFLPPGEGERWSAEIRKQRLLDTQKRQKK